MRFRRSRGDTISSRFCFSSTPTSRCAAIVSESRPGSSTRTAAIIASYCRLFESFTYCSNSDTTRLIAPSTSPAASRWRGSTLIDDAEEAAVLLPLDGAAAVGALDEELDVAVGQLQALDDVGDAAHGVDVLRLRVVDLRVVLRREEHPLVLLQGVLEGADRGRPPDDERHHHVREHDQVPQRDDRKGLVEFH